MLRHQNDFRPAGEVDFMFRRFILLGLACLALVACEKNTKPEETLPKPEISLAGGTYSSPQTVEITCSVSGATIRYTTDGIDPTKNSLQYTGEFTIASSTVLKARAFKTGMNQSPIASATYSFNVGSMYITPQAGTFNHPITVNIYPTTVGTVVHYTLDGTEPDTLSAIYTGPFIVDGNAVLSARGYINGWEPCEVISMIYEFQATAPQLSDPPGTYFSELQVTLTTATEGASIYYTLNGSEPTESSTLYTQPVNISASATLRAVACKPNWQTSEITAAAYMLKAAAPAFQPAPGNYSTEQAVKITSPTAGTTIHYTTDGSTPTPTSTQYNTPVNIAQCTVLRAVAIRTGWTDSNIASGTYNLNVSAPLINPAGGSFSGTQNVSITCTTPGSEIHYTSNNTIPTPDSPLYSNPLVLNASQIIKAKAFKSGWNPSQAVSAEFTINSYQTVATPVFDPAGGNYSASQSVNIYCTTNGAVVRFTDDSTEPGPNSPIFNSSISIYESTILKARAFKTGWNPSQTATAAYVINAMHEDLVYVAGGSFQMGCLDVNGDPDEYPAHSVILSPYYISAHEVTQSEYMAVLETNPSAFPYGAQYPVDMVSFYDAVVYCNLRSIQEGLPPCYEYSGYGFDTSTWPYDWNYATHNNIICHFEFNSYRLPTEAEWEFAARGGTGTNYYNYSGSNNIDAVGWYGYNSGGQTHPVASKQQNELGLFDMTGNVWEIVWDWYGFYSSGTQDNPLGPEQGSGKVFKGGMWYADASYARVSGRSWAPPYYIASTYGFRVARSSL
jgi:formylglycine-generating enzyme required for sulfatase activity